MSDFAICKGYQYGIIPVNGDPPETLWQMVCPISARQAALGALNEGTVRNLQRLGGQLTDDETAATLIRRKLKADLPGGDGILVITAQDLGVWPKGDS